MGKAFFEPWKGSLYNEGLIKGKKVLILGASAYCMDTECKYYEDCIINKNVQKYNNLCPYYIKDKDKKTIAMMPQTEFDEDAARAFRQFLGFMKEYLDKDVNYIYERVAFTNYVQHLIERINTHAADCGEKDFDAFVEVLRNLKPDVVIIWGCVVNQPLKQTKMVDVNIIDKEQYLFQWKNFDGHNILFINPYHPSSSRFAAGSEKETLRSKFDEAVRLLS